MPSNRTPIGRSRHPSFTPEALALFTELEAVPLHHRNTQGFKDGVRQLMRRLHMTDEFWTMNSPLDREGPCHPPDYIANVHWRRCREVREALLATVAEQAILS